MNIAQNWRLNKQRYQLVAVRFANSGAVMFPPRAVEPTPARTAEVIRLQLSETVELQKAGR